nr:RNA-directed DNA polymerase, eukaryota, reverse transcriptase zinc-binding domain protein [Tanacetum cinerariifolium]
MARFGRKPTATHKSTQKFPKNHLNEKPNPTSFSSHANPKRSYATALNDMRNVILAKIAGIWGEPFFVDEDPHDNVSMGRVCIKTKIQGQITDTCKVVIHGKPHNVWVKEFAGWVSDIKDMESTSCNNFEADISDNHDHEVNDCGFYEVEEGEILKPTESQEDEVVKNTQWSVGAEQNEKDHVDNLIILENHKQLPKETSENHKEYSESISKPTEFESFKNKNSHHSKQPFMSSFIASKTSRVNKCKAIAKLCNKHKVAFLGIQETHSIKIEPSKVKRLWGNFQFDFTACPSSGRSGDERVVWIEIGGLPLNAWTTKTYKKIAGIWGEPLFVDEDPHDNVAMGRVPDIKDMESTSCNNSEADTFDNHDHEVNDCGFHEVEEGEILKPTGSQEDEVVKNTQWSVGAEQIEKDHVEPPIILENHKQLPKETSENHKEDSESISKPPGFESLKTRTLTTLNNPLCKCKAIAKLCNKHKVAFLGIQETHSIKIEPSKVKRLWGNFQFDFAACPSSGRSGGLVSIWDPDVFYKLNVFPSENILIIEERIGTVFNQPMFSINSFLMVTYGTSPLGGHLFTRTNNRADKLKRIGTVFNQPMFSINSSLMVNYGTSLLEMKALKPLIKEWSNNRSFTQSRDKEELLKKIKEFDDTNARSTNARRTGDFVIGSQRVTWLSELRNLSMLIKTPFWLPLLVKLRFEMRFGTVIKWISGCLFSATSSILINGGPTCEFNINRGLRQRDPLTLSLHNCYGRPSCEWSRDNIKSLVSILECFHRVSGLKINYHKSNLFGVGVPFDEVSRAALITGCNAMQTPFSYLGLPIDCNMANVKNWDAIVDKFSKRLSKWKSSMLSIGGKATLISSVLGSIGTYYFSLFPMPTVSKKLESIRSHFFLGSDDKSKKILWISWNLVLASKENGGLVLASKENGGLGIGSLYSLNQALIQKWRWHFFNNPNSLWVRLLTSIHGDIDDASSFLNHVGSQGVWGRIVGSINTMHEKGYIPLFSQKTSQQWCLYKIMVWVNNSPLHQQYPRLFHLAMNKECLIRDCWNNGWRLEWSRSISSGSNATNIANLYSQLANYSLNDSEDDWSWAIGTSSFTVKTTREHIDQRYLPNDGMETRWNCFLPKKINIFIWRALRDRLPLRWNLSRKGNDVDSLSCPDLYSWIDDLHISSSRRTILDTICSSCPMDVVEFQE